MGWSVVGRGQRSLREDVSRLILITFQEQLESLAEIERTSSLEDAARRERRRETPSAFPDAEHDGYNRAERKPYDEKDVCAFVGIVS